VDTIAVIDFGGQYTHLIANRIRRLGVYSEIVDPAVSAKELKKVAGIILSGSPHSVLAKERPPFDPAILSLNVPVLGLCYGHQLIALTLGGEVRRGSVREYGYASLSITRTEPLFESLLSPQKIWMSHGDFVSQLPPESSILGFTADCETAAVRYGGKNIFGVQFHPEVTDTPGGMQMLDNFLSLCTTDRSWSARTFVTEIENELKHQCAGKKVFLLVSGGVDSSVAFMLLNRVLGSDRVQGLHIDNGLMRHNESAAIMETLKKSGFDNLTIVDASQRFLDALHNVVDPEKKREIIGNMFISVQQDELARLGLNAQEWMIGQGTIYPDTIESAGTRHADKIKTHHNRVEIIVELIEKGLVVEPLAQLYKDEVRILGEELGLAHDLVWRHPFPGPGLGVRVLCSDKSEPPVLPDAEREVAAIAAQQQLQATILPIRSVGVQGDGRTYAHPVLLRGNAPWEVLEQVSTRITNTVASVNRVVLGINGSAETTYSLISADVNRHRLDLLRIIDHEATSLLRKYDQYGEIWQMPVVLLPLVNDQGGQCVVIRPIVSREAMTARSIPLKRAVLDGIVARAEATDGIGDIFLDITHKPPGTIEWE